MEHSNLQEMISCLEYGTNLHICVVFLENHGNFKTELRRENVIHTKPFCSHMHRDILSSAANIEKCIKCRNLALKKAVESRKPFGGLCFNGVYEYCHPVIYDGDVVAVVMIGNILTHITPLLKPFADTFEKNISEQQCAQFAAIVDNHIKLLLHEYSSFNNDYNPFLSNLILYIEECLFTDITLKHLASVFNYNEKYIGRLFKKNTGMSVKEYINTKRLESAAAMLKKTDFPITDIALRAGFNNVSYFNRLFKKHFNVSPSEYRKNRYVS